MSCIYSCFLIDLINRGYISKDMVALYSKTVAVWIAETRFSMFLRNVFQYSLGTFHIAPPPRFSMLLSNVSVFLKTHFLLFLSHISPCPLATFANASLCLLATFANASQCPFSMLLWHVFSAPKRLSAFLSHISESCFLTLLNHVLQCSLDLCPTKKELVLHEILDQVTSVLSFSGLRLNFIFISKLKRYIQT